MATIQTTSEDWIKRSSWDLPTTLDGLLRALRQNPNRPTFAGWQALMKFRLLPAYRACPPDLKERIDDYLAGDYLAARTPSPEPVTKFDPNHDNRGRFSSYSGGYAHGQYPLKPESGGKQTPSNFFKPPRNPGTGSGPSLATIRQRNSKIRSAVKPSKNMVQANLARLQASNRAGDDLRGSSGSRSDRTQKLLAEFGDGVTCPCVWCGCPLTAATLSQDKIYTLHEGGRYTMDNLLPSCLQCNQSLGVKGE